MKVKRPPIIRIREKDTCIHTWKITIEMIVPDNKFYRQGRSAIKKRTCEKCNKVEYIDFRVERII